MLKIKNITIKNFMSVGSVTKSITLDENDLTLILGDNIDQGSDGSRNGVGKSVIVDALSYALYNAPVRRISLPKLINKINDKNMIVTVDFERDDQQYRIERGKKPEIFKFFVNGIDIEKPIDKKDKAEGEKKNTQVEIVKIFGMSHLLFKHILALYSKTIPFIDEGSAVQRTIIEELLGITQLSEKAAILSSNMKDTKTEIDREEFRHKLVNDSNIQIQQNINQFTIKSTGWDTTHAESLAKFEKNLEKMLEIDIDVEIQKHLDNEERQNKIKTITESNRDKQLVIDEQNRDIQKKHDDNKREQTDLHSQMTRDYNEVVGILSTTEKTLVDITSSEKTLISNNEHLVKHACPECGQDIHDDKHDDMVKKNENEIELISSKKDVCVNDITAIKSIIVEKETLVREQLALIDGITAPVLMENDEMEPVPVLERPNLNYDTIHEAYEHKTNFDNLVTTYEKEVTNENPYIEQIQTITDSIKEIDYEMINELVNLYNHQDFLLKLLTRKDSNIRIQIIEQNLTFLNSRLDHYCKELGLPHQVYFGGDLNVDIIKTGNSYDAGNLSGGEVTRLVLAFSFAFRDVHEALNFPVNIMFVDELIDSGMDSKGAELALHILKNISRNNNKNIYLISHREDFIPRVSNVLMVTFNNNFTDYNYEIDVQP